MAKISLNTLIDAKKIFRVQSQIVDGPIKAINSGLQALARSIIPGYIMAMLVKSNEKYFQM